jgi:DNA-binding transcriptional LysR family regulator
MMGGDMLDPVLLRSFLAVVQTGGFTRAAASLHLTQSTVSQQVRRLEEQLGAELLDRSGRYVVTTTEGERLLGYANRIVALMDEAMLALGQSAVEGEVRLGVPDDFAANSLTSYLADFADTHPGIRLEITSGLSHDVWRAFNAGELDLALIKQRAGSAKGLASWAEPLAWLDSRARPVLARNPVPLAVFPPNGLYRLEMTHALDAMGKPWRIAYVSSSLPGVSAAAEGGLGLTLLPRRLITAAHRELGEAEGFAPVAPVEVALHARNQLPGYARELAAALIEACEGIMSQ